MTVGVYVIRNSVNGKVYVGNSDSIERRWRRHRNDLRKNQHHSIHLQRAWNLDGEDAFVFQVVIQCGTDSLMMYEQTVLDLYDSANENFGYNASAIAGSRRGVKHSEEAKLKMREAAKGRPPQSDESRQAQSELMKRRIAEGRFFSEEHRARISAALVGRKLSAESRRKVSENNGSVCKVFVEIEGRLMKVSEAAKHYGITESSMRKRVRKGQATVVANPDY